MTTILSLKVGGKTRTCSATCHSASGSVCRCICQEKFHGLGFKPKDVEEAKAKAQSRYHEKQFCISKGCPELGIPEGDAAEGYVCPSHSDEAYRIPTMVAVE